MTNKHIFLSQSLLVAGIFIAKGSYNSPSSEILRLHNHWFLNCLEFELVDTQKISLGRLTLTIVVILVVVLVDLVFTSKW